MGATKNSFSLWQYCTYEEDSFDRMVQERIINAEWQEYEHFKETESND